MAAQIDGPSTQPFTVIYTHRIRGELDLLPRLHRFIRRLRGELAAGRVFLVDLGDSCTPDVWPCGPTANRSTLIVLDAMGFDVANVDGVLSPPNRAKLVDQVYVALVDAAHPHQQDDVAFLVAATTQLAAVQLHIILTPDEARYTDDTLTLAPLEAGQVGVARVDADGLLHHSIHTLPTDTPPEPTISGTVEFVREEARYFEKRRSDNDTK